MLHLFTQETKEEAAARKKPRKPARKAQQILNPDGGMDMTLTAAQMAANEQMRKVLEEDRYSALGSIVESDSEDEGSEYRGRGAARLDRSAMLSAMRKRQWMERMGGNALLASQDDVEEEEDNEEDGSRASRHARTKKKRKKPRRNSRDEESLAGTDSEPGGDSVVPSANASVDEPREIDTERDEGSIFGATQGASNATWVECDKCKKVRFRKRSKGCRFFRVSQFFSVHLLFDSGAVFAE